MTFEPIVPIWGLCAVFLLGLALGWFQYLRSVVYGISPATRWILFSLRVIVFGLFVLLLANPQWTRETTRERPPRLLVLFDTSESMNSVESSNSPTIYARLRDDFFKKIFPLWMDKFQIRFYTFSSQIHTSDSEKLRGMETVGGAATDIRGAVLEALSQQGTNRPAAVMVLTDGNHNWGPDPTSDIFRLGGEGEPVPLIAVSTPAFGELKKSLAIPQVTLPSPVFSKEDIEVRFQVVASGAENQKAETSMRIEFMSEPDKWTPMEKGEASQPLQLLGSSTEGSFSTRFPEGGRYRVEIGAAAPGLGSASAVREIVVEPGRWKIAYYCGRAGWLSGSLVRRIGLVPRYSMKAAIGHGPKLWSFVVTGEGGDEEDTKRESLSFEEIAKEANLFIFEGLSKAQQTDIPDEIIRNRVEIGAAVLFISGNVDPLPVEFVNQRGMDTISPVQFGGLFRAPGRKALQLTPDAGSHHVTNLPLLLGVAENLPLGQQMTGGIRTTPDSKTLMEFGDNTPALIVKTVGDSRSAYLDVTDLWRWQFVPGERSESLKRAYEALLDRLVRWLIMGEESTSGRPRLMISQSKVPLGKAVEIGVQYERVVEQATATIRLVATDPNERLLSLSLREQSGGFFTTRFTPSEAGDYTFTVSDPEIPAASDSATIRVEPFSIETAISGAGEDLLRDLAEKTGGVWVDLGQISELTRMDELNRIYEPTILTRTITEPLMSSPWFLVILVLLLSSEWTVRRIRDMP